MSGSDDATRPTGLRLGFGRSEQTPGRARWTVPATWSVPVTAWESRESGRPLATLVSFHYLRAAILRLWPVLAAAAVVGALLAGAFLVLKPTQPIATTTLLLSHDDRLDPARAMATDIGLLATRTVAQRTIGAHGLSVAPEDLLESVQAVPSESAEIMQLTMTAPTQSEAIRWLDAYTQEYLTFRAQQIFAQSDLVIKDYSGRVEALQEQVRTVSARVQTLAVSGDTATDRLGDAITERSQLNNQISQLQAEIEAANLRKSAIVGASRVIDPPAAVPSRGLRRTALVLMSGLIGSIALAGFAIVLGAVLSDRLRLRTEVASALETNVSLSVRRLAPMSAPARVLARSIGLRRLVTRRAIDRQRAAQAIVDNLVFVGARRSMAVLCLGNSREMRFAVVVAAMALQHDGRNVTIVDLTADASVPEGLARLGVEQADGPTVLRPDFIPSLTESPFGLNRRDWRELAATTAQQGLTLILADLDPAVGVDHLKAWTNDALIAVTGGESGVELVRTAGDLVRSAGLRISCAILLGAQRDDTSSGTPTGPSSRRAPALPAGPQRSPESGRGAPEPAVSGSRRDDERS